ncbi:hypothetical protein FOZ61_010889 [Perkinsus olseni]|uniref:GPI-anchored wall transfer protein n=1 Tax=Perkinsus olseni TaxID=32597 RepID=A0A7J6M1X3_PEROL|nr:hypothetical protein FOL46_003781 [Perkinsus olseni]KAF4665477.1 hypothetical protein FOZ61_010889 [Perkinsus olseni]
MSSQGWALLQTPFWESLRPLLRMDDDSYYFGKAFVEPEDHKLIQETGYLNPSGFGTSPGRLLMLFSIFPLCIFARATLVHNPRALWADVLLVSGPLTAALATPALFEVILVGLIFLCGIGIFTGDLRKPALPFAPMSPKRPSVIRFLAEYRSLMMFCTCLIIFAVDYQVFPWAFSKTDTFGYSLMDLGVGCVIFSSAVVSRHSSAPFKPRRVQRDSLMKRILMLPLQPLIALYHAWPVVLLGVLRFLSTTTMGYYVPTSEYGVHWNFFLTIAAVQIFASIIPQRLPTNLLLALALLITGLHQYLLTSPLSNLEEFVFYAERLDFISANKEGIFGVPGFIAIHLFGVVSGRLLFALNYSKNKVGDIFLMVAYGVLFFGTYYGYTFMTDQMGLLPSRRLVNMPFVLATTFGNLYVMGVVAFIDCLIPANREIPLFMQGYQNSMLVMFLVGNAVTGVTNYLQQALLVPTLIATIYIHLYSALLVLVGDYCGRKNLKLKFW